MNRKTFSTGVVAAMAVVGLTACGPAKDDKPPAPKVTAGAAMPAVATPASELPKLPKMGAAPKWEMKDLQGKPVKADHFKGKVVVVDFWATWCPPCLKEIPAYIAMQEKYGKEGLAIVGASIDQAGPEVVEAFAKKAKINYTMLMADDEIAALFGGISAVPTTFLIDRDGQVRYRKEGLEEDFEKKVAAVLAEKA